MAYLSNIYTKNLCKLKQHNKLHRKSARER
jgi:hypothetical protein